MSPGPPRSGWTANFQSPGRFVARAFGLIGDNLACPLSGDSYFPIDYHTLASPKSVTAIQILSGKDVVQRFKPTARLQGISLALVTWAKTPTPHSVEWRAVASLHGENIVLGEGTIVASMIRNQQQIDLPMSVIPEEIPEQIELSFQAAAGGDVTNPLGVVTFEPTDGGQVPLLKLLGFLLRSHRKLV
jgi:hypothetical protein